MATGGMSDQLLCFLGDPIFQIPVRNFMDENCVIFDPTIDPGKEHEQVHSNYKKLIDTLLDSFCQDANITTDQVIGNINKLQQIPDLKEVFYFIFEQITSSTDYAMFCRMMTRRNVMIQEQVLVMIIAATGGLPESMTASGATTQADRPPIRDKVEDELLAEVMRRSREDHAKMLASLRREEEDFRKTLELSEKEVMELRQKKQQLDEEMRKLTMSETSTITTAPKAQPVKVPSSKAAEDKSHTNVSAQPSFPAFGTKTLASQLAQDWPAPADRDYCGSSTTVSHVAAAGTKNLTPEQMEDRQKFLREQRDKLLSMKKDAREKQLKNVEDSQPQRPRSARAARSAMTKDSGDPGSGGNTDDDKRLAMRRAIANKLRQEVIGK